MLLRGGAVAVPSAPFPPTEGGGTRAAAGTLDIRGAGGWRAAAGMLVIRDAKVGATAGRPMGARGEPTVAGDCGEAGVSCGELPGEGTVPWKLPSVLFGPTGMGPNPGDDPGLMRNPLFGAGSGLSPKSSLISASLTTRLT